MNGAQRLTFVQFANRIHSLLITSFNPPLIFVFSGIWIPFWWGRVWLHHDGISTKLYPIGPQPIRSDNAQQSGQQQRTFQCSASETPSASDYAWDEPPFEAYSWSILRIPAGFKEWNSERRRKYWIKSNAKENLCLNPQGKKYVTRRIYNPNQKIHPSHCARPETRILGE